MAYMKEKFEKWITSTPKDNGSYYSKETVSGYISSLRGHTSKLTDVHLTSSDLFNIDNIPDFERAYDAISKSKDFARINESYHRIFSSALQVYRRFLTSYIATESKREFNLSFAEWLEQYPNHKYTKATIKRYIRALEKAEEWLGIDLPHQVLQVDNLQDFSIVQNLIQSADNYKEINQNHGHGDLSASLGAYYKYLLEMSKDSLETTSEEWWPASTEYSPEISKDKWLRLLQDKEIFNENRLRALAAFYKNGGQGSCVEISEKYGNTADYYRMALGVHLAERIAKETGCPLCGQESAKFWPVLFVGRKAKPEERGSYIWKLRPELYEALTEFGISKYLPETIKTGSFDSWEIIDESTAIKHCDKSFFAYNGSGVPKDICWFFDADQLGQGESAALKLLYKDKEYTGKVANETTDRKRTRLFWSAELGSLFAPLSETAGAYATFRKLDTGVYSIELAGGEIEVPEIDVKEAISQIKPYIYARGFDYPDGLIENIYLSLKSKPFVILAGTSGTGKTRLVKLFAEAIGAEYRLVSVRPDWSDGSDLFGHTDLNGNFIPGPVCNAFDTARENPDKPVFLCLDEMNLARVEYYLSDFLSVIESRERFEGKIVTDGIAQYSDGIPDNLYIIGTVNMDETTFPFSKKVLDRANTIEFSYVDLMPQPRTGEILFPQELPNSFLKTEYLVPFLECMHEWDYMNTICAELKAINEVLAQANAHVGYRVRDEIVFYLLNNKNAGNLLTHEQAMDNEIMQKILPRIQGSSAAVKNMLCELFKICAGDYEGIQTESDNASAKMLKASHAPDCKYPKSAKKIAFMVRRYEEDGFTSYWL